MKIFVSSTFDSLRQQSLLAARIIADGQQPLRIYEPPKAGEIYFFDESATDGVEWLLVDEQPDPEGRLAALAVDVYPQVGSRDVALHRGDPLRLANVRCDLEARLVPTRFGPRARCGGIPDEDLMMVRARRAAIASAALEPSLGEQVADGDPEYWRWRQSVKRMIAKLESHAPSLPQKPATVIPFEPKERPLTRTASPWTTVLALAASILLVVGMASLWRLHQLDGALDTARQRMATLSEEKSAAERQLATEIAELKAALEEGGKRAEEIEALRNELAARQQAAEHLAAERAAQERRIAQLAEKLEALQAEPLPEATAIVAMDYQPAGTVTRGVVRIGAKQKSLALLLEVFTGELYDHYRIEVTRSSTGEKVLSTEELAWSGNHLGAVLATAGLEDGDYDIQLFGIEDGEVTELQEHYEMTLVRW